MTNGATKDNEIRFDIRRETGEGTMTETLERQDPGFVKRFALKQLAP